MNELIETIFAGFSVPVCFLYYDGDADAYITYQQTDIDGVLAADDAIQKYVDFYDFDVYSKTNYFKLIADVIDILTAAGFIWQPSRSSGDLYETETKLYHKTLCFAIERSVTDGENRA